jgi:hypothetical protein
MSLASRFSIGTPMKDVAIWFAFRTSVRCFDVRFLLVIILGDGGLQLDVKLGEPDAQEQRSN